MMLSVDEFMDLIEPELAAQVDAMIKAEVNPRLRLAMYDQRDAVLDQLRTATRRINEEAAAKRRHLKKLN